MEGVVAMLKYQLGRFNFEETKPSILPQKILNDRSDNNYYQSA